MHIIAPNLWPGRLHCRIRKAFPHPTQPPPPTFSSFSHNGETTRAWSGCVPALITVIQKSDKEQHLILLQGPFPSLTQLFYLSNKKAARVYLSGLHFFCSVWPANHPRLRGQSSWSCPVGEACTCKGYMSPGMHQVIGGRPRVGKGLKQKSSMQ